MPISGQLIGRTLGVGDLLFSTDDNGRPSSKAARDSLGIFGPGLRPYRRSSVLVNRGWQMVNEADDYFYRSDYSIPVCRWMSIVYRVKAKPSKGDKIGDAKANSETEAIRSPTAARSYAERRHSPRARWTYHRNPGSRNSGVEASMFNS